MVSMGWWSAALVAVCLGCGHGGAGKLGAKGPAFDSAARKFAASSFGTALPAGPSSCKRATECERACRQDTAAACARWGDLVYRDQPHRAESAWLLGCRKTDAPSCARLMQVTGREFRLSNLYGQRACRYGDAAACEFVGIAKLNSAFAPMKSESRPRLLTEAVEHLHRACDAGRWLGCAWSPMALARLGSTTARQKIRELRMKAYGLATRSCGDEDPDACEYIAVHHERLQQKVPAAVFWRKSCLAEYRRAFDDDGRARALKHTAACQRLKQLGASLTAAEKRATGKPVRASHRIAKRIAGYKRLPPPDEIKLHIHKHRRGMARLVTTFEVCVNEIGMVDLVYVRRSSGYTSYDRYLFHHIRAWRYRPYQRDGKNVRVCTNVTFIYKQI